jgi:hypothetical protein
MSMNRLENSLFIRDEATGASLGICYQAEPPGFLVELIDTGLKASLFAYSLEGDRFPEFMRELADSWPGWDGERCWESLEGDFGLRCRHDRLGHVIANIDLRVLGRDGLRWSLQTIIKIEPGSLERIACDAKQMLTRHPPT